MFSPSGFRDLVSGRRRGLGAAMARFGLGLAEGPYSLAVRWRNRRYDTNPKRVHPVAVPVVSVGNLTLGGTGKTPLVEWIARWFQRRGVRVTVISRGYGAEAGAKNDEALELEEKLPDVPHLQNPDRVEAAELAIEEFDCQLILLDDAFQHRRIHRDLDIVLIDALEPFGFGHVFPRGTLREPPSGLRRADIVLLSRSDMLDEGERDRIRSQVRRYAPNVDWGELAHVPTLLRSSGGREAPPDALRGKSVAAFCGVGNPSGFRHTLESCGYGLTGFREFPDHHAYDRADIESLIQWANGLDVESVVCTYKDLVKLGVDEIGRHPLWAIVIGVEVVTGQEELENRLAALVRRVGGEAGPLDCAAEE